MNLEDLAAFVAVAEQRSFSKAARSLGIAKSTASQRVRALETHLDTSLIARSTRSFNLTDAGQALLERGREIVAAAAEAEQAVGALRESPVGLLRVSAPVSFGRRFLSGVIASLLSEHPRLSIALDLADRDVDLVAERYDLAIRVGELPSSSLSALKIGTAKWSVVGAPRYLAAHGRPKTPAELAAHECLRFTHRRNPGVWVFDGPSGREEVRVNGRLLCNHGDVLADTAADGFGLAWLPDFIVAPLLDSGALERVLEAFCDTVAPIQLVFPERQHRTLKARLFADALQKAFARYSQTTRPSSITKIEAPT